MAWNSLARLLKLLLVLQYTYRNSSPVCDADLEYIPKVITSFAQCKAQGEHTTPQDDLREPCTYDLVCSVFLKRHSVSWRTQASRCVKIKTQNLVKPY